jgi:hypothetical protein
MEERGRAIALLAERLHQRRWMAANLRQTHPPAALGTLPENGDLPPWGRSHNPSLTENEANKAQEWADKLIDDHNNGLRRIHVSQLH